MDPRAYDQMDVATRNEFWEAITIIEAQDSLNTMSLLMVPHMAKDAREKLHKEYFKKAHPSLFEKSVVVSPQEAQRRLAERSR